MSELEILLNAIQTAQDQQLVIHHKSDFYGELSERFIDAKERLDEHLKVRSSALGTLERTLIAKRTKAFTTLLCPVVEDPALKVATAIEEINSIITEHNKRTTEFEKRRQEAFTNLERHYAASFVLEQHYNDHLLEMASLNATIAKQRERLAALDGDILELEKEVSEASKGAERINELLGLYFGKNDLRIAVSADNRFQIIRANVAARNLSEGEKTALAFAYFVARVQDGSCPSDDLILVIDDPISSLDANHLFNTYALIKTQLAAYRQLFLSTHSFEFYNLIRDWVAEDEGNDHAKKPQAAWKKWGIFLVRRTGDGTSALEEIPKELLRFKSEYHYLFSILCRFHKTRSGDFDCIFNLPNMVRRFMEAFGGIMIPLSTGLKGKMTRLFTNEVERERVWKFINHYSHNTTILRSLTIPDMSECIAVVEACLNAVRTWDDEYFADLEKEVTV